MEGRKKISQQNEHAKKHKINLSFDTEVKFQLYLRGKQMPGFRSEDGHTNTPQYTDGIYYFFPIKNPTPRTGIPNLYHLQTELLLEIFLRLPGESLHRCKCVQKSWNLVINEILKNPTLVAQHLAKSRSRPSLLIRQPSSKEMLFRDSRKKISQEFSVIRNSNADLVFLDSSIWRLGAYAAAASSLHTPHCDGVVCLHHFSGSAIALINPGISRYRILKDSRGKSPLLRHYVGFGFDEIRRVYKVVRVFFSDDRDNGHTCSAEVWTLGQGRTILDREVGEEEQTGGSWRGIEVQSDHLWSGLSSPDNDQQLYCRGVYYWLSSEWAAENPILSFDMRSETFRTIPSPAFVKDPGILSRCALLTWRSERVVLVRYDFEGEIPTLMLWVLREEKENEGSSWSKLVEIRTLDWFYHPLTFLGEGDELVLQSFGFDRDRGDHLASYNVVTNEFRKLSGIQGMERQIYASTYVQSLVWF